MSLERIHAELQQVLGRLRIQKIIPSNCHMLHEQHCYVAVRDALLECGIPFEKAERLARENTGNPRERIQACVAAIR